MKPMKIERHETEWQIVKITTSMKKLHHYREALDTWKTQCNKGVAIKGTAAKVFAIDIFSAFNVISHMTANDGTIVDDVEFPITWDDNFLDALVFGTNEGPTQNSHSLGQPGDTDPVSSDENSSVHLSTRDVVDTNLHYPGAETLFNRSLSLVKPLRTLADIRYKTDYFPQKGANADKALSPRYLLTADDGQEIIIKFPEGYVSPPDPRIYVLECYLLTVPVANRHWVHVNNFQVDHNDQTVSDRNPHIVSLTAAHFENGEIRVKLVPIKALQRDSKAIKFLHSFGYSTDSDEQINCKSFEELRETYQLNRATIAFSLGYFDGNGQFIRFTNTTVISNEIIEKDRAEAKNNVTCPNCSYHFNINDQEKKNKKRSPSSSKPNKKKRSSSQYQSENNE